MHAIGILVAKKKLEALDSTRRALIKKSAPERMGKTSNVESLILGSMENLFVCHHSGVAERPMQFFNVHAVPSFHRADHLDG